MSFNTPILLLTFTRLDTAVTVFERIREQKPKYFFWASDGARAGRADDVEKIAAVKQYIQDRIDWECELRTLFRDENLGCGKGVSSAITWFFENVEQGIILEDDCVPLPGFFEFCHEMLIFYKDNEQVFEISGTNLQAGRKRGDGSYYFSNYGGIWGWATWARAWKNYDLEMSGLDQFLLNNKIEGILSTKAQQVYYVQALLNARYVDTWDYQWVFTFWKCNGLCIVPNKNLINNIGFGAGSTHTYGEPKWYRKLTDSFDKIIYPIKHPGEVNVNIKADEFLFKNTARPDAFLRLKSLVKKILKVDFYK